MEVGEVWKVLGERSAGCGQRGCSIQASDAQDFRGTALQGGSAARVWGCEYEGVKLTI